MIAEAQAKVAELADLRGRIAAQLRGTQAQLGTALDDLAPQAPTDAPAAPAVRAAPRLAGRGPAAPAVVCRPRARRRGPRSRAPGTSRRLAGRPSTPTSPSTPRRPSRSPGPCPPSGREPWCWTRRRRTTARRTCPATHGRRRHRGRVPGGRGRRGPATVPERSESGEVRRPTQRRRKRQNTGARRWRRVSVACHPACAAAGAASTRCASAAGPPPTRSRPRATSRGGPCPPR